MQLTMLGTSCMMPTKERNPSAVYLEFKGEGILFDCAEGTQRQMRIAGINLAKVSKICISRGQGAQVFGLPGLLLFIFSLVLRVIGAVRTRGLRASARCRF